jgi:hypothetical protein
VYGIAFSGENYQFSMDIDYLFEWVCPSTEQMENNEMAINFRVAPCTLIFTRVREMRVDLEVPSWIELEIADVRRTNARTYGVNTHYDRTIETQQGIITFTATGYRQYVRRQPVFSGSNSIDLEQRGGISFGTQLE